MGTAVERPRDQAGELIYAVGERVRVRAGDPPGHIRTPFYTRGRTGTVIAVFGAFRNPESLAQRGDGLPLQTLYKVKFDSATLWGGRAESPRNSIEVDILGHWLEPVAEDGPGKEQAA